MLETLNLKNNIRVKSEIYKNFPNIVNKPDLNLEDCNSIGEQIRYYRIERDMTLGQLAEKSGLTKNIVRKMEYENYITFENFKRIEKALDVEGKLYIEPYYQFLMDKPVEKIEKYVKEHNLLWKEFAKFIGIDRSVINGWRYHSKVVSRKSFERLQKLEII